jgi:hypothetical protein
MKTASEQVQALLCDVLPERLALELLGHHRELKAAFLCQDWEKCLTRGGKLAEAIMKITRFLRTGETVSSIKVDQEIQQAEKSRLPYELRLLIPRHVRPLYEHRTKRGGGHGSFDPNQLDSSVALALGDWIVGEFVRIYGNASPEDALRLVTQLTTRAVPYTEEIDGDVIVFNSGSCRDQVRLALYRRHPQRTSKGQLKGWLKKHKPHNVDVTLGRMSRDGEIHMNQEGAVLTQLGLKETEKIIAKAVA